MIIWAVVCCFAEYSLLSYNYRLYANEHVHPVGPTKGNCMRHQEKEYTLMVQGRGLGKTVVTFDGRFWKNYILDKPFHTHLLAK